MNFQEVCSLFQNNGLTVLLWSRQLLWVYLRFTPTRMKKVKYSKSVCTNYYIFIIRLYPTTRINLFLGWYWLFMANFFYTQTLCIESNSGILIFPNKPLSQLSNANIDRVWYHLIVPLKIINFYWKPLFQTFSVY